MFGPRSSEAAPSVESAHAVFSVGEGAVCAAQWVSEHRGYPFFFYPDLDSAAKHFPLGRSGTAVLVVDPATTTSESLLRFAEMMAREWPNGGLGFLCGRGSDELLEAAKRLPAKPSLAPAGASQCVFLHPEFSKYVTGPLAVNADDLVTDALDPHDLITQPAEMLYLVGHSNGHDAGVAGVALCRRPAAPEPGDALNVFPCFHGAPCRFEGTPFRQLSVDRLRARRIANLSCWGVTLDDHPFSSRLSIGEGLLRHALVESMLALIRAATIYPEDLLAIYYLCNSGLTFGEAANRANQFRLARGLRADFFCFGDPETRLAPAIAEGTLAPGERERRLVTPSMLDDETDLRFRLAAPADITRPVALLTHHENLKAGLLLGEHLYLTLEGPLDPSVSVRIAALDEVNDAALPLKPVLDDLKHLDCVAAVLSDSELDDDQSSAVAGWVEEVARLRALMESWPPRRLMAGSVASVRKLRQWEQARFDQMESVGVNFTRVTAGFAAKGAVYPMTLADRWFLSRAETVDDAPCPYCGAFVDRLRRTTAWESERSFCVCRACGPIFEGPFPPMASVEAASLRRGVENELVIRVCNSLGFRVPAGGLISMRGFGERKSLTRVFDTASVGPGDAAALKSRLRIPAFWSPGVYHVGASIFIGCRLIHLRRPIQIEALGVR